MGRHSITRISCPPGPSGARFLLGLPRLLHDPLAYFSSLGQRYRSDLIYIQFADAETYLLNHPDLVRHVLLDHPERFSRVEPLKELRPLIGNGLVSSDEEYWVGQRRRIRPAFHRRHDTEVEAVTQEEIDRTLARWAAEGAQVVDVQEDMKRLLLRALVRLMLSPDARLDEAALIHDLDVVLQFASIRGNFVRRLWRDVVEPLGVPPLRHRHIREALARVDAVIYDLIRRCRTGDLPAGLLLVHLLEAEEKGEVDERQIRDEVATFFFAGFDTTAALVTFALMLLAGDEAAQSRLREIARSDSSASDPFPRQVLLETLRLYPPAWSMHRTAVDTEHLAGYVVPPRAHLMVCPYALHRNPSFWPEPNAFRPERFAGTHVNDALVGFHFLPFGQGRHTCIGKHLAMTQARLTLMELLQRYRFSSAGIRRPRISPGIILKSARGVPLRITPV